MSNPRALRLLMALSFVWIVASVAWVIVAYTGYGSDWLIAHVLSCGHHEEGMHRCVPAQAHDAMVQGAWGSLTGSVVIFGFLWLKASGIWGLLTD